MSDYLLGIDVGTSKTKGVIVDVNGKVVASAEQSHNTSQPKAGFFEHDAEAIWWHDFCLVVKELLKKSEVKPEEIMVVGCSALGADMLPIDELGKPIRPAIFYGIDTRSIKQQEKLQRQIDAMGRKNIKLNTGSIGPKILWFKENEPEAFSRMRMVATASTYLVYKLTGIWVIDKYTATAFTPMIDLKLLQWNPEYCKGIVNPTYLPDILWSTEISGKITREAAEQTGLLAGIPVIVGTCDAAAEAVSVGITDIGDMMIMYGTTGFIIGCSDVPINGRGVSAMPYVIPGIYVYASGTAAAGGSMKWFCDNFATGLRLKYRDNFNEIFADLGRNSAEIAPGANGLFFLPYLSGERSPITDPLACGLLFGLNFCHDRIYIYRSILEGVSYSFRHCIENIKEAGGNPTYIVAVGGGSNNYLWVQIVSDVIQLVQEKLKESIGAAYGDAFLAGLGIGMFSSLREIKTKWIKNDKIIRPDKNKKKLYDELYAIYLELYSTTKDLMHKVSNFRK